MRMCLPYPAERPSALVILPSEVAKIGVPVGAEKSIPLWRLLALVNGSVRHPKPEEKDLSPSLLPWASKPWHNIQESVLAIQSNFVKCVLHNVEPETNGADNLKTFALVEGAYLSANERRAIEVADL